LQSEYEKVEREERNSKFFPRLLKLRGKIFPPYEIYQKKSQRIFWKIFFFFNINLKRKSLKKFSQKNADDSPSFSLIKFLKILLEKKQKNFHEIFF